MELELRGITKQFPGVLANDDVSLTARSGKVLALIGENGAGKSTLMNVLSGIYQPDAGEIVIDGVVQSFGDPGDAIKAGIGMVHQHFMLVPVFSVWENVVLGVEPVKGPGIMNRKEARKEVKEISERFGLAVDPDAMVEDLPVGIQQRVEIIKVLLRGAKILVFDEPTAVLTPQEVEEFFGIVAELKGRGATIIFITHKLKEALAIADDITVLRGGKVAGHADPATATPEMLASMMVGRPIDLVVDKSEAAPGETVLQLTDVVMLDDYGRALLDKVSLSVRAGEIVGVAGIQGNGQTELVEAITGLLPDRLRVRGDAGQRHHASQPAATACGRHRACARGPQPHGHDRVVLRRREPRARLLLRTPYSRRGLLKGDVIRASADGPGPAVRRPAADHRQHRRGAVRAERPEDDRGARVHP